MGGHLTIKDTPAKKSLRQNHILDLDEFSKSDIEVIFDNTDSMMEVLTRGIRKVPALRVEETPSESLSTVRSRANGIPFSDQLQEIPGIFPFARIPICSRITCKEIGFPFWCFGAFECSKLSHLTRNVPIFNHSA